MGQGSGDRERPLDLSLCRLQPRNERIELLFEPVAEAGAAQLLQFGVSHGWPFSVRMAAANSGAPAETVLQFTNIGGA